MNLKSVLTKTYLIEEIREKFTAPKDIAFKIGVSTAAIYKYMRIYNIKPKKFVINKCLFCKKKYKSKTIHGIARRQKYCSENCHNKSWVKNNPERHKFLQKESRLRKSLFCKECNQEIKKEDRRSGLVFCSTKCQIIRRSRKNRKYYKKYSKEFLKFKESIGCKICGYNKYGGSLDFHHKNPTKKKGKIGARWWHTQSIAVKKEIRKCILLCKNCHYEQHNRLK
jgi:hypothetical protein